jgi:hypothetical protein
MRASTSVPAAARNDRLAARRQAAEELVQPYALPLGENLDVIDDEHGALIGQDPAYGVGSLALRRPGDVFVTELAGQLREKLQVSGKHEVFQTPFARRSQLADFGGEEDLARVMHSRSQVTGAHG